MEDAYAALNAVTADYDRVNRDFDVQIGTYYDEFTSYKKMLENKKLEVNARLDLAKARAELINLEYLIITAVMDYNSLVLLNN